ncbi:hypothetical protein [Crateriforma conspicua]|nr:hypothetical protein [Crateriforma conspicua]
MRYSIRALLAMTALIAIAITLFLAAPIFTASIVLLAPLSAVVTALCFPSLRHLRRFLLGALPIAMMLFYVGLIGPLCAVAAMPDAWGFANTKRALLQIGPSAYPWFDDRVMPQSVLDPIATYQEGWAAWVNPAW